MVSLKLVAWDMTIYPLGELMVLNIAGDHGSRHFITGNATLHGEATNILTVELNDQPAQVGSIILIHFA